LDYIEWAWLHILVFKNIIFLFVNMNRLVFLILIVDIVSVSYGGDTNLDNLRPICGNYNSIMGNVNMLEFMKKNMLL
jgi:hypothetical protein